MASDHTVMCREAVRSGSVRLAGQPNSSNTRRIELASRCVPLHPSSARSSSAGPRGTSCRWWSGSVRTLTRVACRQLCTTCPTGCAIWTVQSIRFATRWPTSSSRRRSCVFCALTGDAGDDVGLQLVQWWLLLLVQQRDNWTGQVNLRLTHYTSKQDVYQCFEFDDVQSWQCDFCRLQQKVCRGVDDR